MFIHGASVVGFGNAAVTRKIARLPVPPKRRTRMRLRAFTSQGDGALMGGAEAALGSGEGRGDP